MAITINHATHVISIPKSDTTFLETNAVTGYEVRSYSEYALMRELADYLDSEIGAALPVAYSHNTLVTISGVGYARTLSFLSPYTVTFENGSYQVKLIGGTNNNLLDVLNPNSVSVIPANSAGLQTVAIGSGVTAQDKTEIINGVGARTVEGAFTFDEILRIIAAALAGQRSGIGTATETYTGLDGTTPRIILTPDAQGNGTPTLDGGL